MNDIQSGDCLAGMAAMGPESVHAIVTDPPYELAFMGRKWDSTGISFRPETWAAALRVAKPGAHLVAFGGTRTWHRIATAIEDGGWEIRDTLCWLHGQGFPKSLDVSKSIDKAAGDVRPVLGGKAGNSCDGNPCRCTTDNGRYGKTVHSPETSAASAASAAWSGWGTALKPAFEPIILARKPFSGTVAANVLYHGTGALNVDGCRVGTGKRVPGAPRGPQHRIYGKYGAEDGSESGHDPNVGRWPTNVLLSHTPECVKTGTSAIRGDEREGRQGRRPGSFFAPGAGKGTEKPNGPLYGGTTVETFDCIPECPVHLLDEQSGDRQSGDYGLMGYRRAGVAPMPSVKGDFGGASRFFYTAKASRADRGHENKHPTVKPSALMRWLVRLVTPPGGLVLDPFTGSGTTALACLCEGFDFIGFEQDEVSAKIARDRIRDEASLFHGEVSA